MTFDSRVYSGQQVRELDRIAIEEVGIAGLILMKRAAIACVDALFERWPHAKRVAVLCGAGNNAGDGYIIAGLLSNRGLDVQLVCIGKPPADGSDAAQARSFCLEAQVEISTDSELPVACDLIVDALLGTGIKGAVRPAYEWLIRQVNDSGLPVLAVDIPSGLCADTGAVLGAAIDATVTVTFIGKKLGLLTNNGPEHCGDLVLCDLAVPAEVYEQVPSVVRTLQFSQLIRQLAPRHRNSHKVSHGHLLVVGGDRGMGGAVAMASEAALYTGVGMVTVATHPDNALTAGVRRPEVMVRGITNIDELDPLLARCSVIVLGPGLGQSDWSQGVFDRVMASDRPIVLDADGLNLLAKEPQQRQDWILTPHPGEAGRLLGHAVQADRLNAVLELQEKFGGTCLLKGAGSLIASGDGVSVCTYGNPGMSVAGMGDVLSGVLGALRAQGLDTRQAAQLGVVMHSLAADNLVAQQGERGLLATELFAEIRRLVNSQ